MEFAGQDLDKFNYLFGSLYNASEDKIKRIARIDNGLAKELKLFQHKLHYYNAKYTASTINLCKKRFYMDIRTQKVMDHYIRSTKNKWDFVLLITGVEGSAKTTLAKAIGYYLTKKFNPKNTFDNRNIIFTADQFYEAVDKARPGSAIIWDEFVMAGMSTDMGSIQNAIIKKFTMIRKKQLFIILVIPFMWMLRSYFAIARTKILINVYSPDFIRRGYYAVWGYSKKRELYFKGTNSGSKWSYKTVRPSYTANFLKDIAQPNFFTDDEEYERKKDEATLSVTNSKHMTEQEKIEQEKQAKMEKGIKYTKACKKCGTRNIYAFPLEKRNKCLTCGDSFKIGREQRGKRVSKTKKKSIKEIKGET